MKQTSLKGIPNRDQSLWIHWSFFEIQICVYWQTWKAVYQPAWNACRPVNSHPLPNGFTKPPFFLFNLTAIALAYMNSKKKKGKCFNSKSKIDLGYPIETVLASLHPLLEGSFGLAIRSLPYFFFFSLQVLVILRASGCCLCLHLKVHFCAEGFSGTF